MSHLDQQLQDLLSTRDDDVALPEPNFYKEVWASFSGENSAFMIWTWVGILLFGGGLIYCVVQIFRVESVRDLVFWMGFAIMLNSAQIALKLWYNMRLNRTAILKEIRRLRIEMLASD